MKHGQSLFEVVFAVAIAALVVVTIVSLSNKSLATTTSSADRSQATRYVQQISECLREQRDTDWVAFVFNGGASCAGSVSVTAQFSPPNIAFTCQDASDTTINCATVNSVVTVNADISIAWTDGSGTHTVNSVTQYTDWRRL